MRKRSIRKLPVETEYDKKLLAWLERNAPWLMKLPADKIMWRVGLEMDHGRLLGRSIDDSLLAAAGILRQAYEDGQSYQTSGAQESANEEEKDDDDGK